MVSGYDDGELDADFFADRRLTSQVVVKTGRPGRQAWLDRLLGLRYYEVVTSAYWARGCKASPCMLELLRHTVSQSGLLAGSLRASADICCKVSARGGISDLFAAR